MGNGKCILVIVQIFIQPLGIFQNVAQAHAAPRPSLCTRGALWQLSATLRLNHEEKGQIFLKGNFFTG